MMRILSPPIAQPVDLARSDDRLLRDRVRVVASLVFAAQVAFALADLWLNAELFLTLLLLKLVPGVAAIVILILLRREPSRIVSTYSLIAIFVTSSIASAVSGAITNDAATTPILVLIGVLGAALLIPWGPRAQAASVLGATGSILLNQVAVTGTVPLNYATLGIAIGLGMSIYTVYLFDRYRGALIEQNRALESQTRSSTRTRTQWRTISRTRFR